jgi:hypothetical protein
MKTQLQTIHVGYAQNGKDAVLSPPTGKQVQFYEASLMNGSGGAINMGILKKLNLDTVGVYALTVSATPDAAAANGIKAGTATQIFSLNDNDGFLVGCTTRFNLIGLNVSTASVGGVFALTYYNGTNYVSLTTIDVPTAFAAGVNLILFAAPHDWVVGTTAAVGGDATQYNIRVLASTHPTNAVAANAIWVAQMLTYQEAVADNGTLTSTIYSQYPLRLSGGEGIMPYFGGTASAANLARCIYAIND